MCECFSVPLHSLIENISIDPLLMHRSVDSDITASRFY